MRAVSKSTSLVFALVASTLSGACAARMRTIEKPIAVSNNDCVTAVERTTTKGKETVRTEVSGITYDRACGDRQIEAARIRSAAEIEAAQIKAAADVITKSLSEATDPVARQRILAAIVENMDSKDERVRLAQAEANKQTGLTETQIRKLAAQCLQNPAKPGEYICA